MTETHLKVYVKFLVTYFPCNDGTYLEWVLSQAGSVTQTDTGVNRRNVGEFDQL